MTELDFSVMFPSSADRATKLRNAMQIAYELGQDVEWNRASRKMVETIEAQFYKVIDEVIAEVLGDKT